MRDGERPLLSADPDKVVNRDGWQLLLQYDSIVQELNARMEKLRALYAP